MKKKISGLILLICVMIAVGVIYMFKTSAPKTITADGYVGGEKIEFLEDPEVQSILEEKYGVTVDYSRAVRSI